MPFAFDVRPDGVTRWAKAGDGAEPTRDDDYAPSIHVGGPDAALADCREWLAANPKVAAVERERWYTDLHAHARGTREATLRVDVARPGEERTLARELRGQYARERHPPGALRLYNVDLAPGFRYCVETDTDPTPTAPLSALSLSLPEAGVRDRDVTDLRVGDERVGGTERAALRALSDRLADRDPDVLVVSDGDLVPLLAGRADALGEGLQLGRRPGWERLAGESTYASYGQVGHSPARYDVPGRVVVDTSNSFLWADASLAGLLDLVDRSWRPLQETAWGSIGTVLTDVQTREALSRGVLVPWNKWEPESFKDARTLHAADRGGFTFAPEVGLHEDVHEVDFASLYPTIICEHNVSAETVDCPCHDRADVPELGYSLCDDDGFLPDVLRPIVDDRAAIKAELADCDPEDPADPERVADLRARKSALKWVLVSCFGYQGYRNAKFGRIECHETINAVARDLMLDAKAVIEAAGWRVVHGIVDSLWITPADDRAGADAGPPDPVDAVVDAVSDGTGIPLEHEGAYDWVAFVPRRDAAGGALTRYFGRRADGGFKLRGIEARQRSTPAHVERVQRDLLDVLDEHRDPRAVVDRLGRHLRDLRAGEADPADLVVTRRVSKRAGDYDRETRAVGALRRADALDLARHPGQSVRYVVVDDDAGRTRERVRLACEDPVTYDADHYATLALRAGTSVVAPFGWDREDVRRALADERDSTLAAFSE